MIPSINLHPLPTKLASIHNMYDLATMVKVTSLMRRSASSHFRSVSLFVYIVHEGVVVHSTELTM